MEITTRPLLAFNEQQRLFDTYPLFFRSVHYPEIYRSNLGHLGIQCGIGWYSIVEEVVEEIEPILHTVWSAPAYHIEAMARLEHQLQARNLGDTYYMLPFCTEISEKDGRLHIEVIQGCLSDTFVMGILQKLIDAAQARSEKTCVSCGALGTYRSGYWNHVYCGTCVTDNKRRQC